MFVDMSNKIFSKKAGFFKRLFESKYDEQTLIDIIC